MPEPHWSACTKYTERSSGESAKPELSGSIRPRGQSHAPAGDVVEIQLSRIRLLIPGEVEKVHAIPGHTPVAPRAPAEFGCLLLLRSTDSACLHRPSFDGPFVVHRLAVKRLMRGVPAIVRELH